MDNEQHGKRSTRDTNSNDAKRQYKTAPEEKVIELSYGEIASVLSDSGLKMSASSVHNYIMSAYRKFAAKILRQYNDREPTAEEIEELSNNIEFHYMIGESLRQIWKNDKSLLNVVHKYS